MSSVKWTTERWEISHHNSGTRISRLSGNFPYAVHLEAPDVSALDWTLAELHPVLSELGYPYHIHSLPDKAASCLILFTQESELCSAGDSKERILHLERAIRRKCGMPNPGFALCAKASGQGRFEPEIRFNPIFKSSVPK